MTFFVFVKVGGVGKGCFRVMLKDFEITKLFPCCLASFSVIDHRRRQNAVRTSVTHLAMASYATFLFFPHFDVICDLLLNRRTQHGIYLLSRVTVRFHDDSCIKRVFTTLERR